MKNFRKLTDWYFSKKSLPYWCIFWIDCAVIYLSYLFIYQQINSGAQALGIFGQLSAVFAIFTMFHAIGFRMFHTYDGILRYSSFVDLQKVFYAVTVGAVLSVLTKNLLLNTQLFPGVEIQYRNIILGSLISILILWAIRVITKTVFDDREMNSNLTTITTKLCDADDVPNLFNKQLIEIVGCNVLNYSKTIVTVDTHYAALVLCI